VGGAVPQQLLLYPNYGTLWAGVTACGGSAWRVAEQAGSVTRGLPAMPASGCAAEARVGPAALAVETSRLHSAAPVPGDEAGVLSIPRSAAPNRNCEANAVCCIHRD
jgi:hypothetical protein